MKTEPFTDTPRAGEWAMLPDGRIGRIVEDQWYWLHVVFGCGASIVVFPEPGMPETHWKYTHIYDRKLRKVIY